MDHSNVKPQNLITALIAAALLLAIAAQLCTAQTPPSAVGARIELRNAIGRPLDLTYVYRDGEGASVSGGVGAPGSIEQGQTWVGTFEDASGGIVSVEIYAPEISGILVGNSYVRNETSSGVRLVGIVPLGGGSPYVKYKFTVYPSESVPDAAKTLWETDDTTLTANLFREGVDKIVAGQGNAGVTSASTGSLDGTKVEQVAEYQYNLITGATLPTDASSQSNAAVAQMESALNTNVVRLQGNVTVSITGDPDDAFWTVQLPKGNGQFITLDLNPMHVTGVPIIAQWVKIAISVLIVYLFEAWCWEQFRGLLQAGAIVPQAHGNTVAGSGGQATGLVNAALLATILTSLPAAAWIVYTASFTVINTVFPATTPIDILPSSGGEPFFTQGFIVVNHFIPCTLIAIIAAQIFIVRKMRLMLFALSSIAIKYIQF